MRPDRIGSPAEARHHPCEHPHAAHQQDGEEQAERQREDQVRAELLERWGGRRRQTAWLSWGCFVLGWLFLAV